MLLNPIEEIWEIVASIVWTFRQTQEIFQAKLEGHEATVGSKENR